MNIVDEEAKAHAKMEAEIKEEKATLAEYEKVENLGEESAQIIAVTSCLLKGTATWR